MSTKVNKTASVQKFTWENMNGELRTKTDSHGKHKMASDDCLLLTGN